VSMLDPSIFTETERKECRTLMGCTVLEISTDYMLKYNNGERFTKQDFSERD
jgi:hypothetical protein